MSTRFSLGIDLGTTNSAIALTDLETDQTEVLEVTQFLGPNQIGEKPTLPSALYTPHRDEKRGGRGRLLADLVRSKNLGDFQHLGLIRLQIGERDCTVGC